MMLTSGAEKILDKDQVLTEKLKHKEVHNSSQINLKLKQNPKYLNIMRLMSL